MVDEQKHSQPEPDDASPHLDESAERAGGEIPSEAEWQQLESELDAARAERDEHYEMLMRAQAELDNYRKRVAREREDDARYRALPLARDLLAVIDNLERAVAAGRKTDNVEDVVQGVEMVARQLVDVLAQHHVLPIPAEGEPFDPHQHDAISQIPTNEHPPLTVLQEAERGYMLHDRVLRPSKVIVAKELPGSEN